MSNDVVDSQVLGEPPRKRQSGKLRWLSIVMLWLGLGCCLIQGMLQNPKMLAAAIVLSISTVVYFRNTEFGAKLVLGVIALGVIRVLDFFPFSYSFGFHFDEWQLGVELIMLAIGVLHFATNSEYLYFQVDSSIENDVDVERVAYTRKMGFKKRFSSRTDRQLEEIAANQALLPEANKAAQELLSERQGGRSGPTTIS